MTTFASPVSVGSVVVSADPLRSAVSAYLARFKGVSREHTCSDLNTFVIWCTERGVEALAAQRSDLEWFVRWMQETRRFEPSTVARRTSVVAGFYRTCVIDGVLDHSPAEHVRRPTVPAMAARRHGRIRLKAGRSDDLGTVTAEPVPGRRHSTTAASAAVGALRPHISVRRLAVMALRIVASRIRQYGRDRVTRSTHKR